ncbi:MAG TPA: protein kinase, partial [Terriglobales bacterium]|nr:protein kinase [Terriglobales bacterium]
MNDAWKQWEGHVVDGRFTLRDFQGKSDHSAVFQTAYGPYAQAAALKFVEANPATAQAQLARWQRIAKLEHPHLLRVFHWGRCQLGTAPMLYVITDFADENLAQILPNRALTPPETEFMLRSVLDVLGYLHNSGFAHGRVKPGNIMAVGDDLRLSGDTIRPSGEKDLSPHLPTPYDAPEMTTAGSSPAGDIWSLGITIVEAVTQKASPAEAVRLADPTLPETMPAPFLEIARQCLRLDPQRRWTVADIAAHLLPTGAPAKKSSRAPYAIAAGTVLIAGLVVGPKLLHRTPASTTSTTSAPAADPEIEVPHRAPAQPERVPSAPSSLAESTHHKPAAPATPAPAPTAPASNAAMKNSEGAVADRVLPKVSQRSLNTITGKVKVTVKLAVDPNGKVTNAAL